MQPIDSKLGYAETRLHNFHHNLENQDYLWCHPGDGAGEAHAGGGLLAVPGSGGAKVRDLDDLVAADEDVGALEVPVDDRNHYNLVNIIIILFISIIITIILPVDDLVVVEVLHAGSDLLGPVDQPLGRHLVLPVPQEVEEGPVGAVLHHDAVAGILWIVIGRNE